MAQKTEDHVSVYEVDSFCSFLNISSQDYCFLNIAVTQLQTLDTLSSAVNFTMRYFVQQCTGSLMGKLVARVQFMGQNSLELGC